jgi:hypothetical protein
VLLALKPSMFLTVHDLILDRSKLNRSAQWRKNVHKREYKLLGLMFAAVGVSLIVIVLTRLFSNS